MKKVLIISSSPRHNSNSYLLCKEFERGALEARHSVELVRLADKKINYCIGCYACSKLGHCFQNDDMNELALKMQEADVIVLASPVYFYSMSGQLKVFIDRLVQNYTKIHADIYLLITAWDSDVENLQSTLEAIRGCTCDCFEDCQEKGCIVVGGVNQAGDIKGRKELLQAYNMGENI